MVGLLSKEQGIVFVCGNNLRPRGLCQVKCQLAAEKDLVNLGG